MARWGTFIWGWQLTRYGWDNVIVPKEVESGENRRARKNKMSKADMNE